MSTWRASDPQRYRDALVRQVTLRPRDPFLLSQYCSETLQEVISRTIPSATALRHAAASVILIPPSPVYDERRGGVFFLAAHVIAVAATVEQSGQRTGSACVEKAEQALPVLETFETYYPLFPDPGELILQNRLSLLGAANRIHQAFDYAIRYKDRVWNVAGACYNTACYASLLGQYDLGWKYLERAFRDLGHDGVKYAAADPDLEPLRKAKSAEWNAFFSVKVRALIEHGMIADDITFDNLGSYPMTNIRLTCYTHYVDGKCNTLELRAERVNPGNTYRWSNVLSVPGKRFTTSVLRCYLACDQAEASLNSAVKAAGEP